MTWWEAGLLGLIQGLTEFLPVSSSGHLVIGQQVLGLDPTSDVTFEVFVHFGTALSISTIYWRRARIITVETFRAALRPATLQASYTTSEEVRTGCFVALTLIPTGLVYVMLKDPLEAAFSSPRLACGMLLVTGVLLMLTMLRKNPGGRLTPGKALVVGLAQAAAILPGLSRSGATICAALYQNVKPDKAADFSFLMLLPVVLAATLLKSLELVEAPTDISWGPLVVGTAVAYVSGVAAISVVLNIVRRGRLHYFAYYCFGVGALGLVLL